MTAIEQKSANESNNLYRARHIAVSITIDC